MQPHSPSRADGPTLESLEPRLLLSGETPWVGWFNDPVIVEMSQNMDVGEGSSALFYAVATDADGDPLTYTWDFGDGTDPVVGDTLTHAYADNGSYGVILRVTDGVGGVRVGRLTVTVHNVAPTVDAGADLVVDEWQSISLTGSLTDPGSADTHGYLWDFGDGTTSTDLAASHTYTDNGTYTVTLTVTDDDGGIGTDTLAVTVRNVAPTIVDLSGDTEVDEGEAASFSAAATDLGDGPVVYTWSFGDGTDPVTGQSVNHVYSDAGTYTVTLVVTDEDGATAEQTLTVTVEDSAPAVPLDFSHRQRAIFARDDGSSVVVSLRGPGQGKLYLGDGETFDISRIVLEGTAARSRLRIRVLPGDGAPAGGDVVVGDIDVDGSLSALVGRNVDLTGDLNVEGWVGKIVLDDLLGASITIGGAGAGVRLWFDQVADTSIDSASPIRHLKATEWLDLDGVADSIAGPSLWKLRTTGSADRGIRGDFEADLTLTGCGRDAFPALGRARIAGDLNGSTWDVLGSIGTLRVDGTASGSTVRATGSILRLHLGAANGSDFLAGVAADAGRHAAAAADFVNPRACIGSLRITGLAGAPAAERFVVDSNFSAARIGCVRLTNLATDNAGQEFGLYVRGSRSGRHIGKVKHVEAATAQRWTWRSRRGTGSGEVLRKGDFVVKVL